MRQLKSPAFPSCTCIEAFAALANGSSTLLPSFFFQSGFKKCEKNSEGSIGCFFFFFFWCNIRKTGFTFVCKPKVVILGWGNCPLPQGTQLMQTWDSLKVFRNADKLCSYVRSCALFILRYLLSLSF